MAPHRRVEVAVIHICKADAGFCIMHALSKQAARPFSYIKSRLASFQKEGAGTREQRRRGEMDVSLLRPSRLGSGVVVAFCVGRRETSTREDGACRGSRTLGVCRGKHTSVTQLGEDTYADNAWRRLVVSAHRDGDA